jgi:TcpE family
LDLPTYTNIWRIEKRLYKLYDFRLPMPIPVGQIAVFSAIAVPYVLILKMVGLPFSHTLLWLYILPPGALAWLVTRPVLEGKRLPELVVSQVRYLNEPRTWCRMAPLAERAEVVVVARVWRRAGSGAAVVSPLLAATETGAAGPAIGAASVPEPAALEAAAAGRAVPATAVPATAAQEPAAPGPAVAVPAAETAPGRPALERHLPTGPVAPWPEAAAAAALPVSEAADGSAAPPAPVPPSGETPEAPARLAAAAAQTVPGEVPPAAPAAPPRPRPVVTVTGDQPGEHPIRMVERALGNPSQRRMPGWRDQVVVVPGGHRPGQPDQLQRDRARARVPLPTGRRVVVLGCTVGAGQTVTALMTGELLATLRDEQVAVLDLNPGDGCLAERAQAVPSLTGSATPAPSRLEVVTRENAGGDGTDGEDITRVFELLSARYPLTLADPGAAAVPRVLAAAAQLIMVAPASQDAAAALATTREWLEAHGHTGLADGAITVLNGVSKHTMPYVEQAEALARGRCRAIVRVPWDDRLKSHGQERLTSSAQAGTAAPGTVAGSLSPAALHAYTALAGVLVTALAIGAPEQLRARP